MFGYRIIKEKKYQDMQYLILMLNSFVFVAKTDGKRSAAVEFADGYLRSFRTEYGE